jgi:hypothetical protein
MSPFGITGDELDIRGVQNVEFSLNNRKFGHQFYVCSLPTEAQGILGTDFLRRMKASLDLQGQELV